jgi:hypothetical protein
MIPLLADAIEAHGGLDRWKTHHTLTATIVSGGDLWALKGVPQDPIARTMQVELHRQWASVAPFGKDRHTDFTSDRIAILEADGSVVAERSDPRASFARHDIRTSWDPLHRAYFNGYADLPHHTIPARHGRYQGRGNRALARGSGNLARLEGNLSRGDRQPQL